MAEKPLLTISLLCSGRPETKKSLDSLKTLRERVQSELILVDTGCDEEMRKLLYAYADEVISFKWCNDFAKARNVGLEKARGQWFMFLDDDEWFIDTKALEDFFLSGEYKYYGYAEYVQRNYLDEAGNFYEDDWAERLACLQYGIKFQGIIHECFTPVKMNKKRLPSVVEHYGYVYQSPEEKKRHTERNLTLLKKALAENEEDIRMWSHLLQEYRASEDYEGLRSSAEEALRKFENRDDKNINRERGCYYCGLLEADIGLKDYKAAQTDYERAVADQRNTDHCIARLSAYGAEVYAYNNDVEKETVCCRRYLEIWEYYKTRQEELAGQETIFVCQAFVQIIWNQIYCHLICLGLKAGDSSSLKKYFNLLGWEKRQVFMTEQFIPCLVKAMEELPYEEFYVYVANILANKPGMDIFWEEIEKIKDEAGSIRLIRILSEVTGDFGDKTGKRLQEMLKAEKEDNWEGFSAALKKTVEVCAPLGEILKRYAQFYAKRRMEKAKEKNAENISASNTTEKADVQGTGQSPAVSAELQALADQVKAQIPILLAQGMKQEAIQVLEQLRSLMPEDEELEELMRAFSTATLTPLT